VSIRLQGFIGVLVRARGCADQRRRGRSGRAALLGAWPLRGGDCQELTRGQPGPRARGHPSRPGVCPLTASTPWSAVPPA